MNRDEMMDRVRGQREPWDIVVIGGGATGAGIAVDAASRGYSVLLLEQHDFGKGTSSRSTKLAHGGVRYLARGDVALVREALRERGLMRQNAPHLVHELPFVVPSYSRWSTLFYGLGLKAYSLLAGRQKFGPTQLISRAETLSRVPTLKTDRLRGGIVYFDGQFDDARLLINLMATAAERGATLLNYARVTGLSFNANGRVEGVQFQDVESGREMHAAARVVVNAAGVFCDAVRHLADAGSKPLVAPSQGIHLVFDRSFLPGDTAFVVPKTPDGRVMFAIPWHGHTLVGTTDNAVSETSLEPRPTESEIAFVLETAGRYLQKPPAHSDILSAWAGIRPLVSAGNKNTAALFARPHHSDRSFGPGHHHRRKMDHIPQHGGRLRRSRGRVWATRRAAVHHQHAPDSRLPRVCESVWRAGDVRIGCAWGRGTGARGAETGPAASPRSSLHRSRDRMGGAF